MKLPSTTFQFVTNFSTIVFVLSWNTGDAFSSTSDDVQVQGSGWSGGGTVPPPKPGECPPSDPQIHCFEQKNLCNSDCECPRKQKCCFQKDCGYSCSEPTIIIDEISTCNATITATKRGVCPKPLDTLDCFGCIDQCKSDCECPGTEKCCPQPGCGNMCRDLNISPIFY